MKILKRILALVIILLIIGIVLVLIGAGALALFPNKQIFGFNLAYIKFNNEGNKIEYTSFNIEDQFDSAFNDIIVNSSSFNVKVVFDEKQPLNDENLVRIRYKGSMQGFSTSPLEDLKLGFTLDESKLSAGQLVINTYEPNGWKLTNRCDLEIRLVREHLNKLTIKTNGKVNVNEGCFIDNLNVTSNSTKADNVIVNAECDNFVMTNHSGSGAYKSFTGNIEINSKSGSFSFENVEGDVTANGTQMHLKVDNLNGSLKYNIDYGKGIFGVINKDTYINSKGTNITINDAKKGIYVTQGGNSKITIKNNGEEGAAIVNEIVMDKGEFNLSNSYHITNIKMNNGKININGMKNFVYVNKDATTINSKAKINISFDENVVYNDTDICLIARTNGDIDVQNICGAIDISAQEKSDIILGFKNVKGVSDIRVPNSNVTMRVPNNERYNIVLYVDNLNDINLDVEGKGSSDYVGTPTKVDGVYTATYEIGVGQATNREIRLKTAKPLSVLSNQ